MNAVYWQHGSSKGILKNSEVKSAMVNPAGRILFDHLFHVGCLPPFIRDNLIKVSEIYCKSPPVNGLRIDELGT